MFRDRRPYLGPQGLLVRYDAGAGQSGRRIVRQAGELRDPYRHAAEGALERDVLHRQARYPAPQEPRDGDQQTGRPGVPVQSEAGHDVRAPPLSVVPQDLRLVPGQEGVEAGPARREQGGGGPAVALGGRFPGVELRDRQPGKGLGQPCVGIRDGRGHAGTTDFTIVDR